jgi:hypothetical protein
MEKLFSSICNGQKKAMVKKTDGIGERMLPSVP